MSILSDALGTSAKHGPSLSDRTAGAWRNIEARRAPIFDAINNQYAAQVDPTRRNVLGSFASRGFGLSGMADQGIAGALADLKAKQLRELQNANENITQQELGGAAAAYANQNAEQAAKRDKFLGIF